MKLIQFKYQPFTELVSKFKKIYTGGIVTKSNRKIVGRGHIDTNQINTFIFVLYFHKCMKKDPIDLQLFVDKNLLFIYYCKLHLEHKLYLRSHTSYDVAIVF